MSALVSGAGLPNGAMQRASAGPSPGDLPREGARAGEHGPEDPGPDASAASCLLIMPRSTDAARSLRKNSAAAAAWSAAPLSGAPPAWVPLPAAESSWANIGPRFRAPAAEVGTWAMAADGGSVPGETIPAQRGSGRHPQGLGARNAAPRRSRRTPLRLAVPGQAPPLSPGSKAQSVSNATAGDAALAETHLESDARGSGSRSNACRSRELAVLSQRAPSLLRCCRGQPPGPIGPRWQRSALAGGVCARRLTLSAAPIPVPFPLGFAIVTNTVRPSRARISRWEQAQPTSTRHGGGSLSCTMARLRSARKRTWPRCTAPDHVHRVMPGKWQGFSVCG